MIMRSLLRLVLFCVALLAFRSSVELCYAVDYFEGQPRIPLMNLGAHVQKQYAATGKMVCKGNAQGTAQLTVKANIITTVGHALENPFSCEHLSHPNQCIFTVRSHGRERSIPIKRLVGTGLHCPQPAKV